MEIKLHALETYALPELQGKLLVVSTQSDGFSGTFNGNYNYEVDLEDGEFYVYPTLWNNDKQRFIRADELVVYTKEDIVYYSANTRVDPYNHVDIRSLKVEDGMEKSKRVIQAFSYFADDLFSFGNYNLFVSSITQGDNPNYVHVTKIELSKTTLSIPVGGTATLTATVLPEEAENKKFTWESANPEIVTIDETGKLTTVANGEATIKAVALDGGISTSCRVDVYIPVTGVTFSDEAITLVVGATKQEVATVAPTNAANKAVTYSSLDDKVASIGDTGVVKGVGAGTTKVVATTIDGKKTASVNVTVTEPEPEPAATETAESTTEPKAEMETSPAES